MYRKQKLYTGLQHTCEKMLMYYCDISVKSQTGFTVSQILWYINTFISAAPETFCPREVFMGVLGYVCEDFVC